METALRRIDIAGVGFDAVTFAQAVRVIEQLLESGERGQLIVTPNPEMVLAAQDDADFRAVLNSAVLAAPDGIGAVWAGYFLSAPRQMWEVATTMVELVLRRPRVFSILSRPVTGTDLMPEILRLAAQREERVFLLGAAPGVAEETAARFRSEIPGLIIAGTYAGSPRVEDEAAIIDRITVSEATVLFLAYGAPAQELWLARNLPRLPQVKIGIGVGGAFDFHAGRVPRAPALFRALGLEWLFRLIRQPQRARRIWNATGRFIALVWRHRRRV